MASLVDKPACVLLHSLASLVAFEIGARGQDLSVYQADDECVELVDKVSALSDAIAGKVPQFRDSEFYPAWKSVAPILKSTQAGMNYAASVNKVWVAVSVVFRIHFDPMRLKSLDPLVILCAKTTTICANILKDDILETNVVVDVGAMLEEYQDVDIEDKDEEFRALRKAPNDDKVMKLALAFAKAGQFHWTSNSLMFTSHPKIRILALDILIDQFPEGDSLRANYPFTGKRIELLLTKAQELGALNTVESNARAIFCLENLPYDHTWKQFVFGSGSMPRNLPCNHVEMLRRLKLENLRLRFQQLARR